MEFLLAQSGTFDATNLIAAVITAGITIAIWVGNRTGRRAQLELEEKRLGLIASLKQLAADSPNEATKIRVSKAADDVLLQVCEALVVESDASHTPEVATRVTERIPLHRKLLLLISPLSTFGRICQGMYFLSIFAVMVSIANPMVVYKTSQEDLSPYSVLKAVIAANIFGLIGWLFANFAIADWRVTKRTFENDTAQ